MGIKGLPTWSTRPGSWLRCGACEQGTLACVCRSIGPACPGTISEVFNEVVALNQRLAREFADLTQSHANVRAQLTDLTEMATRSRPGA